MRSPVGVVRARYSWLGISSRQSLDCAATAKSLSGDHLHVDKHGSGENGETRGSEHVEQLSEINTKL